MNEELVDRVVHAVLYEGYILYPYRASARKNRQRFTFGRVYPRAYSVAQGGAEPFVVQTECLLRSREELPVLEIEVRFLHLMAREVGTLSKPELPGLVGTETFQPVPELRIDGSLYQTWQEAVERKVQLPRHALNGAESRPVTVPFCFPASLALQPICDRQGQTAGLIRR